MAVRKQIARFEHRDLSLSLIEGLKPDRSTQAVVEWSSTNRIMRTCSGLKFDPTEASKLTAGQSRIKVFLNDIAVGVFIYWGGTIEHLPTGDFLTANPCPDRTFQLDFPLTDLYGIEPGALLTDALVEVCGGAGIPEADMDITASPRVCGSVPMTWGPFQTTRLEIANQLCVHLGYLPLHADRDGRLIARPVPVPENDGPTLYPSGPAKYASGQNAQAVSGSATESDGPPAPNVYAARSPLTGRYGVYRVPSSEPNSVESIGFENPAEPIDVPGAESDAVAAEVAKARAKQDVKVRSIEFLSTPNPYHGEFDVIEWEGERMLEHGWRLPLVDQMSHTVKSVYADD